jgi:hypothetical protein
MLSKLHPGFIGTAGCQRYSGCHECLPVALTRRGKWMRFSTVAGGVCLWLCSVAGGFAAASPAQFADTPAIPAAPATPAAAKPSTSAPAAPPSGDAAAKHAKRTACLKDAKTKKLVGADKTSFLKGCIAAP